MSSAWVRTPGANLCSCFRLPGLEKPFSTGSETVAHQYHASDDGMSEPLDEATLGGLHCNTRRSG